MDHTYFRQKSGSNEASATTGVPGPTSAGVTSGDGLQVRPVTTLELYAEEASSKSQPTLTLTETSANPVVKMGGEPSNAAPEGATAPVYKSNVPVASIDGQAAKPMPPHSSPAKSFSISSILGEDVDKKSPPVANDLASQQSNVQDSRVTTDIRDTGQPKSMIAAPGINNQK